MLSKPCVLPAQPSADPYQYEEQIAYFLEAGKADSFGIYVQKKCLIAQQIDSLELWATERFNANEAFEKPPALGLQGLEDIWNQRWRDPKTAAEWYPFLYIQATRGWYQFELGNIWQSLQTYEMAAHLYEQYRYTDFDALEIVYKPLGSHYIRLGDDDKAIAVFQKALALGGDSESLSGLYCDIGLAHWNKGDFAAAEANYRKGLNFKGISGLKRSLLLGALAQTQLDKGQTKEAAQTAAQSLSLLQKEKVSKAVRKYRCYSRRTAGIASIKLGRLAEAERLLNTALDDALAVFGPVSRDVGKIEVARAQLYLQLGKPMDAFDATNRALSAVIPNFKPAPFSPTDQSNRPSTNPLPNQFYEENTIFEALAVKAEAAQKIFEKTRQLGWLELALECHDLAWRAESLLRKVFQYSSSKLNLQKDTRTREEVAMNLTRALFEQTGQPMWLEKAFSIAERSKAALLLDAMQDNLLRQGMAGSDPRFETLGTLRKNLSFFEKNLLLDPQSEQASAWQMEADRMRTQMVALEQTLRKTYPGFYAVETSNSNWLPISTDFSATEALLGYFVSADWVDVFVFQSNQTSSWIRLPNDPELQGMIRRYLDYFENDYAILNDPNGYLQTAYALGQKLLPAQTVSANALCILPDGILNFVPFEALVSTMDGRPTLRTAAYILRRQSVRYAWSLAVLRQQKNLQSKAPNYLLSIAPGFINRERGLAPLGTPVFRWKGINGWNRQELSAQDASLQAFLKVAGGYQVLHFSTHAFSDGNPRIELIDSSLLLPDLYALPLKADLVMLSACETGLGKEEKGEGVMSLARAFAQAGAACIVSSLWSVNDASTSRLLNYFYDNLGNGHRSALALQEAKLAYLSDPEVGSAAQTPYFWAGLVVVGDDRVISQPLGLLEWAAGLGVLLLIILALRWRRKAKR